MKFLLPAVFMLLFLAGTFAGNAQSNSETISFRVNGVCVQCQQRIQKSLRIKGVKTSSWDVNTKMLTVTFNPDLVSPNRLHETVAAVGHDTEIKKAEDKTYNALPECCHYRGMTDVSEMLMADTTENKDHIMGIVVETRKGENFPLTGANISWLGSGKVTVSNIHGEFILHRENNSDKIIISYSGFTADTVSVEGMYNIQVTLNRNEKLSGIVVTARQRTSYIDNYNPFRTAIITKKELLKAACCNLSESFETNPSVDVSYTDAATGSKQIQLLGLAGAYTQLTVENLPGPRGLATPLGLNSIAGPWVESIQLIKGTGSVVNGFESIAGQINVELKKPRESEKLYLNGYVNSMGKTDVNVNLAQKINSKWSTGLLLHDDFLFSKQDFNKDGFRDLPTGNQFNGIHRWDYIGNNGLMSELGIKVLFDDRTGGQVDFNPSEDKLSTNHYGLGIKTKRYEAFAKIGYVYPEKLHKSIGLQVSAFDHDQDSYFGLTGYQAHQKNFYSNLIYQTRLGNEKHQLKTGLSFLHDQYKEHLDVSTFDRTENVPGAFTEYIFSPNEKFDIVSGIRADYNNLYGWFATPRLNIRYQPFNMTTVRLIVGRGQRTANIFAENMGVLVSSRQIIIMNGQPGKAYGLDPEVAWNKGISVDQKFRLFNHDANLAM
ncbi:MAG: TonB-dependent receptor domain-containing protein, partial [Flavisolibacter sp.]